MSEWQPIETAPRDGTAVLLAWARDADGRVVDWRETPREAGVFVQVASWWENDGWWVYFGTPHDGPLHFDPTHWMPLPEPPAPEGE